MATRWTEKIAARNSRKEVNTPWWVNDKFKLHNFCVDNGFPRPKVYAFWKSPDEIDLDETPEKFVLKPTVMFSAWGVMLLEKRPDGTFYERLKNRSLTVAQIVAEQKAVYERCKYKGPYRLMVEERIEGAESGEPIPFDYKVSVFYDQPGHVLQINRNHKVTEHAFFDGSFQPLDLSSNIVSDWTTNRQGLPQRPDCSAEMLRVASELTKALKTPFMRVDMFATQDGPVIGELTPSPGDAFYGNHYRYSDSYDVELGHLWTEAERRLAAASA